MARSDYATEHLLVTKDQFKTVVSYAERNNLRRTQVVELLCALLERAEVKGVNYNELVVFLNKEGTGNVL